MNTITFDDLDTPLTATPIKEGRTVFTEPCKKCGGKGIVTIGYTYVRSAKCFACDGQGKHEFKTSPEHRAKAKASAARRKEAAAEVLAQQVIQWTDSFPAEFKWMNESAPTFEFAQSMLVALYKFGSLTEKQMATVQRLTAQSAERKIRIESERAERQASAPSVDITTIETAFANAKSSGLKFPKLRLADFIFSPASDASKNAGAIYVKSGDQYLGKISAGRFFKVRECDDTTEQQVLQVASDPKMAAVAFGMRTGVCSCCGAKLTNKESIERGIGPICAGRYGW
jgi:hypothetical protein